KLEQELKTNPYKALCNISGIGFKKADNIILNTPKEVLNVQYDIKNSKQRMSSCIEYVLKQSESEGHTRMDVRELRKQCLDLVPESIEYFVDSIKEDDNLYLDK